MICAIINSGRNTMCTSSSGATNSSKTLEKVEAVESGISLRSLIPKEFTAESQNYVTGKKIEFYEKVFTECSSFAGWIIAPVIAGLGVKT